MTLSASCVLKRDDNQRKTDKPMSSLEKKEVEKEKVKRKQEYFAAKKNKQNKRNPPKPRRKYN